MLSARRRCPFDVAGECVGLVGGGQIWAEEVKIGKGGEKESALVI
jgi:hypothetical protein